MPTNGMTIDGLNTVSSLTAQDEVPVWDKEESGEPTRKITAQNMANSVKSLASLPNTTEMNAAIAQSTASFEFKSLRFTLANNATYNITATTVFVVSVKNAVSDQIMGGVLFSSYLGNEMRVNPIQNPAMIGLSYSNGIYTITNTGGMYQTFMVLYK